MHKKSSKVPKKPKIYFTNEKIIFFLVKESVTYYVKVNQYRVCRRFFMSLKDFAVDKIMLCINRFTKNIPTQQNKSVEKERFYNIWNWEDRVESGKG